MIENYKAEYQLYEDKKLKNHNFRENIETIDNFKRITLFNLPSEIPFIVISSIPLFIEFSVVYNYIYFIIIVLYIVIFFFYKLTSIENMLLFIKIQLNGILLFLIVHSIENKVFLVLSVIGNCLGFYSSFLTCTIYNENLNKNVIKQFKNQIKFIDAIFGSLANLFLLFPTIKLIFELNDYKISFESISGYIILFHGLIFGVALIIINIWASIVTQFIQNSTAFYTFFVGKVVVGFSFSFCPIFYCIEFDSKMGFLNLFFFILGASFMLVDFIIVLCNKCQK